MICDSWILILYTHNTFSYYTCWNWIIHCGRRLYSSKWLKVFLDIKDSFLTELSRILFIANWHLFSKTLRIKLFVSVSQNIGRLLELVFLTSLFKHSYFLNYVINFLACQSSWSWYLLTFKANEILRQSLNC